MRIWRRALTIAIPLAVAISCSFAATANAVAATYECTFTSDQPSYKGWATVAFRGCVTPGSASTTECRGATAYRWTGSAWQTVLLNECGGIGQVYAWPFASGWTWIWSSRHGWLAIRSSQVLVSAGWVAPSCGACQ